ncbi:MAG: glycosyltransferase family 4 protein [Candidatus Eisenbacteria bacterium]|nr:glycosyltransferase family 4 protein [Candidatus Eisenbacteria bacterium]
MSGAPVAPRGPRPAQDRPAAQRRQRILLIGPRPPPECGTSIPFDALVRFVRGRAAADVAVINTTSGSKRGYSLASKRVLGPFAGIFASFMKQIGRCDTILIYGSQRFAATAGSLFSVIASLLGKKAGIYVQGGGFDVYYSSLAPACRAGVRFAFRRARAVGVQTEQLRRSLREEFPNLSVIPNWTDLGSSPLDVALAPAGAAGGGRPAEKPAGEVRFLYLGQVKREKGILPLIEAFRGAHERLSARGVASRLDIYGPEVDGVLAEARQILIEMKDLIVHRGEVAHERIPEVLRSSDILALPTAWPTEGYPAVVIEAMTHGLPVIATRFRALPEIVAHDATGLLCEPGDAASLMECMVRLAADPELRRSMGEAGRKAARRFDSAAVLPILCRTFGIRLADVDEAQ